MKLHSPAFERSLRKRVRREIRQAPELQREYKASGRHKRWFSSAPLYRLFLSGILTGTVWTVFQRTGHTSTSIAVLGLWLAAFVPLQANRLIQCLYGSTDISALICLPLADRDIWRWQFQKFWRGSAWLLLDVTCSLIVVGAAVGLSPLEWSLILPVAVASWLLVISISLLCLIHLYWLPYHHAPSFFMIMGLVLVFGRDIVNSRLIGLIDRCAPDVNHFLPTAWPGAVFEAILPGGSAIGLVLIVPIVALVWTLKTSLTMLRDRYV
ncbi:MAG TPA: hypothetical protein VK968_16865, partial [Roseimicrobium sp.]|nr:hypothetical protein [Roseimicrobium sp.]